MSADAPPGHPEQHSRDGPPVCEECGAEKEVAVSSRNITGWLCPNGCDL